MKIFLVIVVLLNLHGCQSLNLNQSTQTSTRDGSKTISIENPLFTAHINVPQKLQTNKEFTINANLEVNTEQTLAITSRNKMFVFLIKDSSGKQINSYVTKDAGLNREFSGKTTISEAYNYKINEPGIYEVSAVAEFMVDTDGSSKAQNYKIETAPRTIEVTD